MAHGYWHHRLSLSPLAAADLDAAVADFVKLDQLLGGLEVLDTQLGLIDAAGIKKLVPLLQTNGHGIDHGPLRVPKRMIQLVMFPPSEVFSAFGILPQTDTNMILE